MSKQTRDNEAWQPIATAPMDATTIEVKMKDGTVKNAHWACDMSGEDQPPFRGWFEEIGQRGAAYFNQIKTPTHWRPFP